MHTYLRKYFVFREFLDFPSLVFLRVVLNYLKPLAGPKAREEARALTLNIFSQINYSQVLNRPSPIVPS
jgi:hypothetical protein